MRILFGCFFFSSRRRHTRCYRDWSSDVCSSDLVAVQTEASGGLTLMLDYGIFYEFVPVEDLGLGRPRRHTVADVELERNYAIVLTTPAGLWSYILGDTVRFTARDPLRLVITGRVRHFVNACGENVIVEEVEQAMVSACDANGAEVAEFTVAPRYPSATDPRGGHDWIVEFHRPPRDGQRFVRSIDTALSALNTDYRITRTGDVGMTAPRVLAVAPGTFHQWMRTAGKLGDQHKVPRVMNHRDLADALLAASRPPPVGNGRVRDLTAARLTASPERFSSPGVNPERRPSRFERGIP